nr:ribonuclease H-like domain-containing protein [Tanacetum cinerariifolium]
MGFVSLNSTSSFNEADTTASGVSTDHTQDTTINSTSIDNLSDAVICTFLVSQPNSPQLAKADLEKVDPDDLEEMDLHWEIAMLIIRTGRNLDMNGQRIGFDKSKVEYFNCHKNGHFARECRAPKNQDNRGREFERKTVPVENPIENALIAQDGIRGYDWSYQDEEEIPTNYAFMALTSSGSSLSSKSEVDSCSNLCMKAYDNLKEQYDSLTLDYKKSQYNLLSYKAGNYMPPKHDLRLIDEQFKSVYVDVISNIAPIDVMTVKTIDVNHKYDCDQRVVKQVWNNTKRVNHKNFANKFTYPHPKRRFVPQAVLTRSGKINTAGASVTTVVRPVNIVGSKSTVNHPRLISNAFKRGKSQFIRPFNKEARLKFKKLMKLCAKLSDIVLDLEKTKTDQAKEIADLKKRVKRLKRKRRSRTPRMNLFKIGTFRRRSLDEDDASKQGRNLKQRVRIGNKVLKRTVGTSEETYEPTSAEEKLNRRNEIKSKGTLLMVLPNKDQLKFHSYQDAKLLMEAIEKRYGRNKESKKVQRTLLKKQYENFIASSSETLDQTFDGLQKLISQLEIQGVVIQQEDMNLKLLRSLPSEWKNHDLIWRNKADVKTISLDDFTSSFNEADTTSSGVSTGHTQDTTVNSTSVDNLSDAVICAFLASFDKSKVECFNYLKNGHFARECRASKNQENRGREFGRKTVPVETPIENVLIARDGIGGYDWSYQAEEEILTNYAFMALTSSGSSSSFKSEEPKLIMKNNFSHPIIEDWHSDDESEVEISPIVEVKIVKPSVEKIKSVKTARKTIKPEESPKQHKHHPRGNQRNRNNLMSQRLGSNFKMINKASYVCGSFERLQYDCDQTVVKQVWNNTRRVNHKNFANKFTYPHPKRRFVPQAVLTRSGKINTDDASVTTVVRPVNTVGSKLTINYPRLISNAFKRGNSHVIRPFNKYSSYKKTIFNNEVNAVKASGCWVCKPNQNIIDHVSKQNSASLTLKRFDYINVQGSGEAKLKLKELMELCTKLSDIVLDLEKTKTGQAKEIAC